jgi:hypothetical protein
MSTSYANIGPPFNFLGHLSYSQKTSFETWINARTKNFTPIQQHHQMRAQQMRKTAGVLEKFYQQYWTEPLAPNFRKGAWQPGPNGHFAYTYRNDHAPMVTVTGIKDNFKEQLNRQDEAVFAMNHVRTMIEMNEDNAQYANQATAETTTQLQALDNMFSQPQFQAVLVQDQSDTYQGVSRFRVSPLDPPTPWELAIANRTYTPPSST